jgi:hypothetical protein
MDRRVWLRSGTRTALDDAGIRARIAGVDAGVDQGGG